MTTIHSAYIEYPGDASVGIHDHVIDIEHVDLDLTVFADEDVGEVLADFVSSLDSMARAVFGDTEHHRVILFYDGDRADLGELPPHVIAYDVFQSDEPEEGY